MSYNPPLHPTAPNSAPFLAAHSDPTLTAALNDLTFGGITPSPSPELTAPLPTVDSLSALQRVLPLQADATHLPWIRDVLFLTERLNVQGLHDPRLRSLATAAASALLRILSGPEPHPPEAFYLRGLFHLNGAALEWVQKDHRNAFRDFELAATRGWAKAWFRLGRDYEIANDVPRARDCFERGMQADSEACIYRLGMAKLLGQLGYLPSTEDALPLLYRSAMLASIENPHPAYVWSLLLSGEFSVQERLLYRFLAPASSLLDDARKFLERAAYYGFAAAQVKLGQAYEYAPPPYPFEPLRSMQYYSLASEQGEAEADMALSKWFLCGWTGAFDKDETLAVSFAEKAARKGLASAEFAMGYYTEVGIGGSKDIEASRHWYTKAVQHGNPEAGLRLSSLSQPAPQVLSRLEHDQITDARLVRRRTQAYNEAAASGRAAPLRADQSARVVRQVQAQAKLTPTGTPLNPPASQAPRPFEQPPVVPNGFPPGTYHQQPGYPPSNMHQRQGSLPTSTMATLPPHRHATSPPSLLNPNAPTHGRYSSASNVSPLQPPQLQRRPSPNANQPAGAWSQVPPQITQVQGQHQRRPSGPATFADMGFQAGKARDKDCIVM